MSGVTGLFGGGQRTSAERKSASPWELPEVSDIEIEKAMRELQGVIFSGGSAAGQKRKTSGASTGNSPKRLRRRSWGSGEYMMAGAL